MSDKPDLNVTLADVLHAVQQIGAKMDRMEKRLSERMDKIKENQQTIIQVVNELKEKEDN